MRKIIFLLGLPGAGKGTQGAVLAKELRVPHISTGDILRKKLQDDSKDSQLLAGYMNEGNLVPDDLVNKIVKGFVDSQECSRGCILDGYPRTIEQAEYFVRNIDSNINVIFFDIEADIVKKRILGRFSCASCGKLYNKYFNTTKKDGVCDECGSTEFVERVDDTESKILTRIENYKKETLPLIEYFKNKGKFFTVNAGATREQVANEVSSIIKKI
jgi:adenylate kinase